MPDDTGAATKKDASPSKEAAKAAKAESYDLFKESDGDGNGKLGREEIEAYVATQANLWKMLSDNFGLSLEECQGVATGVAVELAAEGDRKAFKKGVDKRQFHRFRTKYIEDPEGNVEFFDRCIFRIFDADGDGVLGEDELDKLLDGLYSTTDFYATGSNPELGELKLPPKTTFKKELMTSDRDGDGKFSLSEIRRYLTKLRKRSRKEDARRASDATSFSAQVRAESEAIWEAKFKAASDEKRKKEEKEAAVLAKQKEQEGECVLFDWFWTMAGY